MEYSTIVEYPLSEFYAAFKQYQRSIDHAEITDEIDTYGFAQIDVSDVVSLCTHITLDENYSLIWYLTREYNGDHGRVAAIRNGVDCNAWLEGDDGDDEPTMILPEAAADPMEVVYHDGSPAGHIEAVILTHLFDWLSFSRFLYDHHSELLDSRPCDMTENWCELLHVPDWRLRYYPAINERHGRPASVIVFRRIFEHGYHASSGIDRINMEEYSFSKSVRDHLSRLLWLGQKDDPAPFRTHITDTERYDAAHRCCLFIPSGFKIAHQKKAAHGKLYSDAI